MRDLASAKLRAAGRTNVDLLIGDLFAWEPDKLHDAVVFCFWLSHVPLDRSDRFWENVHGSLRPGGRFFLADNRGSVSPREPSFLASSSTATSFIIRRARSTWSRLPTCGGSKTVAATGS